MKKQREILLDTPLFRGIAPQELEELLGCLQATERTFAKGSFVYVEGDKASHVGVVLAGQVQVLQEDYLGNRTILAEIGPGGLFAETFVCAGVPTMPVSVQAAVKTRVLLLNYGKILTSCSSACTFHARLVQNMLAVLAGKALALNRKLGHLSHRTMREKLLSYLGEQATIEGNSHFTIPFNRQQLADYLMVDRSALSAELSRMQAEGLVRYHKNEFHLPGMKGAGDD